MNIIQELVVIQNERLLKNKSFSTLENIYTPHNRRVYENYFQTVETQIYPLINDYAKIILQKFRYSDNKPEFNNNNKGWSKFEKELRTDLEAQFVMEYLNKNFIDKFFNKKSTQVNQVKIENNKSRKFQSHKSTALIYLDVYLGMTNIYIQIDFSIEMIDDNKKLITNEYNLSIPVIKIDRKNNTLTLLEEHKFEDNYIQTQLDKFDYNMNLVNQIKNTLSSFKF